MTLCYIIVNGVKYPVDMLSGEDVFVQHPNLSIVMGPLLCFLLLLVLMKLFLALWRKMGSMGLTDPIVKNNFTAGITLVLIYCALSRVASASFLKVVMLTGMTFFGMILRETASKERVDVDRLHAMVRNIFSPNGKSDADKGRGTLASGNENDTNRS